jgi:hypothetical protein
MNIDIVKKEISYFFNVSIDKLYKDRKRKILQLDESHIYLFFCYKYISESIVKITESIGYDHSSIYHSIYKCNNIHDTGPKYKSFENYMTYQYELTIVDRKKKPYSYKKQPNSKAHKRAVTQYDKHYNFINRFESISEAAKKTSICVSSITKSCRNTNYFAKNYRFCYE